MMSIPDRYSGENAYIYSSRILNFRGISSVNKLLSSDVFLMSLDSNNTLSYKKDGKITHDILEIQMALNEQGMHVENHRDFIESNSHQIYHYAFLIALNMLLAEKRLFNSSYSFPLPKIRLFMHPVSIATEKSDNFELYLPLVSIYDDGTIQFSFKSISGFNNYTEKELMENTINKSQLNVTSFLCCKDLLLAAINHELSKEPLLTKFINRKELYHIIELSLERPHTIEFGEEELTLFNLVQTDVITITDISRNLLSLLASSIEKERITLDFKWFKKRFQDTSLGSFWCAKPVVFIDEHSRQMKKSSDNWNSHKYFVDSVMSRVTPAPEQLNKTKDIRLFNDFNHFFSDSISLVLMAQNATEYLNAQDSYTFDNVIADTLTLNEIGEYIKIYYNYAEKRIEKCQNTIELVQEELSIINFESSLISAQKYGEIAAFIENVKSGDFVSKSIENVNKRLEGVRKSLDLNERISSDIDSKRITIFFGVLASASLSPEFIQPALQSMDLAPKEDSTLKIVGFIISIIFICLCLPLTKLIWRHHPRK
ncbi:hypothetical protein [Aeromonas hydrophila]|uniref:hypothetical protein n=1 Tax=Aeromonas hydrophila TaxID=644 RepID=UPI001FC8DA46|nr:hypothetical protein [Aeromonas hydrophila]GKQ97406.1 hypothetical protein KAM461_16560 [Aeromonas hydrophila]